MEVVSLGSVRLASLIWQARPGAWVMTLVCRSTFELQPDVCKPARVEDPPNEDDDHWDDDAQRSLRSASDLAPYKPRPEVLVTGSAYAPPGRTAHAVHARIVVGDVDKSVLVHADRAYAMDGSLREGPRFQKMSLRWERAAGGADTANPVGVNPSAVNASGETALPNVLPVGFVPQYRGEVIASVGFGPIAPSWPGRREKLGRWAGRFSMQALRGALLPTDIDPLFFQVASRDQWSSGIADDAQIVLEHLYPQEARLVTRLPGERPRAFVERNGQAQDLALRLDTLWIDTDRRTVAVVWRGQLAVSSPEERGRVLVGMESPNRPLTWAAATQMVGAPPAARLAEEAESLSEDDFRSAEDTMLPGTAAGGGAVSETLFLMGAPAAAQTMPFASGGREVAPERRAAQQAADAQGAVLPSGWTPQGGSAPVRPSAPGAGNIDASATMDLSSALSGGAQAAPADVVLPPPFAIARPPMDEWAAKPAPVKEVALAAPLAKATELGADAGRLGLAGLMEAAAGAHKALQGREEESRDEAPAPKPRARPAEVLKLLWHDAKVLPRLHKHPEWRILLAEMELRQLDEMEDEAPQGEEDNARKSVFEVLSRGLPSPAESLRNALSEAVDDRGAFEPPLVLLSGELEFGFDEVETLRATITVLTPLAPTEKRLKDALDSAGEFLRTPGADQFGRLAENHTERLREAFSQARRTLPADYADAHVERALLRQRAYSMKTLYGKRWIRALLKGAGPVAPPVYLPEALKDELPAYKRVKVKALGEVDLQEDQEEAAGWVVKIAAVARVILGW